MTEDIRPIQQQAMLNGRPLTDADRARLQQAQAAYQEYVAKATPEGRQAELAAALQKWR